MYVTTVASLLVTAYNLYTNVFLTNLGVPGRILPIVVGVDARRAFQQYRHAPAGVPGPAAARV